MLLRPVSQETCIAEKDYNPTGTLDWFKMYQNAGYGISMACLYFCNRQTGGILCRKVKI